MTFQSQRLHIFGGNVTCIQPDLDTLAAKPLFGDMYFFQFSEILAGAFTGACCLTTFITIFHHASRFSNPKEQKLIVRILLFPPVFASLTFGCLFVKYNAAYLLAVNMLYEAVALTSLFILLCCYLDNNEEDRALFFLNLPTENSGTYGGSFPWYSKLCKMVFQYVPVRLAVTIITIITQATGRYCGWSRSIYFAHIWLTVIGTISAIITILAILKFVTHMRIELRPHSPILKIAAAKLLISLNILQSFIFSLAFTHLKPAAKLSRADQSLAIPCLITCVEAFVFAILNFIAFPSWPYSLERDMHRGMDGNVEIQVKREYQGGVLGCNAIWAAINISDIVREFMAAFAGRTASASALVAAHGGYGYGNGNGSGNRSVEPAVGKPYAKFAAHGRAASRSPVSS